MMVVIMGCGRVGAAVATRLAEEGHAVTVLDTDGYAFSRLPSGKLAPRPAFRRRS